jgi:hypothetical protein
MALVEEIPRDRPVSIPDRGLEVGGEEVDDILNRACELGQRLCWEPPVPKRWLKEQIAVHVHVRLWPARRECEPRDVCVAFYPPSVCDSALQDGAGVVVRHEVQRSGTGAARVAEVAERWMDHAMLVHVVEPCNYVEKVTVPVCLPGVIRLQLLDDCPVGLSDAVEPRGDDALELRRGVANGELGFFARRAVVGESGELADEVVECGAEVVGVVAEQEAEMGRRLPDDLDRENVLFGVRPELGPDFIGLSFSGVPFVEGGRFGIEDAQVLVCPIELGAGAVQ